MAAVMLATSLLNLVSYECALYIYANSFASEMNYRFDVFLLKLVLKLTRVPYIKKFLKKYNDTLIRLCHKNVSSDDDIFTVT